MANNRMLEPVNQPGSRGLRNPGTGSEPTTLSTAIFSGRGPSRISGVASRPSRKIPKMWSQKGLACWKRRLKRAGSV